MPVGTVILELTFMVATIQNRHAIGSGRFPLKFPLARIGKFTQSYWSAGDPNLV